MLTRTAQVNLEDELPAARSFRLLKSQAVWTSPKSPAGSNYEQKKLRFSALQRKRKQDQYRSKWGGVLKWRYPSHHPFSWDFSLNHPAMGVPPWKPEGLWPWASTPATGMPGSSPCVAWTPYRWSRQFAAWLKGRSHQRLEDVTTWSMAYCFDGLISLRLHRFYVLFGEAPKIKLNGCILWFLLSHWTWDSWVSWPRWISRFPEVPPRPKFARPSHLQLCWHGLCHSAHQTSHHHQRCFKLLRISFSSQSYL